MSQAFNIDFFQFLVTPIVGLVSKITSPKGIRYPVEDRVQYNLHHELIDVYRGEATHVFPGLYWVFEIYKKGSDYTRNSYLFEVTDEGIVKPVAEYLNYLNLEWIPESLSILKKYFKGESLPQIHITQISIPQVTKNPGTDKSYKKLKK